MKVWGIHVSNARRIVAASSKKRAAELVGVTYHQFTVFASETRNATEVKLALTKPGTVYETFSAWGDGPWEAITPKETEAQTIKSPIFQVEEKVTSRTKFEEWAKRKGFPQQDWPNMFHAWQAGRRSHDTLFQDIREEACHKAHFSSPTGIEWSRGKIMGLCDRALFDLFDTHEETS